MPDQKPWEKYGAASAPVPVTIRPPSPRLPYEGPLAAADLAARQQEAQIRALQLTKLRGEVNPPASDPRFDGLTGGAYLQHLSATDQAKVRALAEGRMAFPSGAGMRSPYWQQMIDHVAHYDPTFDAVNYQSRQRTRVDFTSGKAAQNIRALNTAIGHLGELADQMHDTQSSSMPALNAVGNYWDRNVLGQSGPTRYDQTAAAVASELTQVFRGTGGAEADVKRFLSELSVNASEEQKRAAYQNLAGLLQSRLDALGGQYSQGMGTTRDGLSLLNPHAQAVLQAVTDGHTPRERNIDPRNAIGAPGALSITGGGNQPPPGPPPVIGAGPQGGSTPPGTPPMTVAQLRPDAGAGAGPGATSIEKGSVEHFSTVQDRAYQAALQNAFNQGATRDQINELAQKFGYPPFPAGRAPKGGSATLEDAIDYRDKGGHGATMTLPQTGSRPISLGQQINNNLADTDVGTAAIHAGLAVGALPNGVTRLAGRALGFNGDMRQAFGNPEQNDAVMSYLDAQHHKSAITGDIVGGLAGAGGMEALAAKGLGRLGLNEGTRATLAPILGDTAFGTLQGAGNAQQGNELEGALIGGAAGAGGGIAGRYVAAPIASRIAAPIINSRPGVAVGNAVGGMFAGGANAGRRALKLPEVPFTPSTIPAAPSVADATIYGAANKAGIPDVQASLAEAQRLGVPMALADTAPQLNTLAGAAVRRSPSADQMAQDALLPRSRGQIDRLGQAVDTHLGPVGNIPQLSADLQQQARTAAGPLYDQAYAAPGAGNVDLTDLMARPSMKAGMGRAYRIAQEEGRDPTALGFNLNQAGEPVLERVPSYQTLDYLKRGIDDSLEPFRNQMTQKIPFNEDTKAINGTRQTLLGRMDAANPAYAQARQAYAGPMQARDALSSGQDAYTANPQQLGVDIAGSSPEQMQQMQLGYRGALMDQANRVRFSGNPFDATLGTPAAEQRLGTMYPGNPGNADLLRTRDLESGLARSTNDILGNSRTAQRQIADQSFAGGDGAQMMVDAGLNIVTGQVPIGLIAKKGSLTFARDALQMGLGKRAVAKADAIAPTLFNTDPAAASAALTDLVNSSQAYRDFILGQRRKIGGRLGMFGAGASASMTGN